MAAVAEIFTNHHGGEPSPGMYQTSRRQTKGFNFVGFRGAQTFTKNCSNLYGGNVPILMAAIDVVGMVANYKGKSRKPRCDQGCAFTTRVSARIGAMRTQLLTEMKHNSVHFVMISHL